MVGLVHDLGKVMAFYGEPQWAGVGDTFPVGCRHQPSIVFSEWSFRDNVDAKNKNYKWDIIWFYGFGTNVVLFSAPSTGFMSLTVASTT